MSTTINFPDSPSVDDTYVYGSVTYTFNGTQWQIDGNGVTFEALDAIGDVGTGANQLTEGNDARLSDVRTPSDSSVTTDKLDPRYKTIVAMAALDVNFTSGQVFTKTITGNSTLTFSNLHIGVKDLEITGDYTLGFPTWIEVISGEYDGTVVNLIQVKITNDGSGVESGWATINPKAA